MFVLKCYFEILLFSRYLPRKQEQVREMVGHNPVLPFLDNFNIRTGIPYLGSELTIPPVRSQITYTLSCYAKCNVIRLF